MRSNCRIPARESARSCRFNLLTHVSRYLPPRSSTSFVEYEPTIRQCLGAVLDGAPDLARSLTADIVDETVELAREHWDVVETIDSLDRWCYRTAATLLEARGHIA